MSNRELAKDLIDQIPEAKLYYVISYLQGVIVPDETPNDETLKAVQEIENGDGTVFSGDTQALFDTLLED